MEIVILEDTEAVAVNAARRVSQLISAEPNAVLGLATGGTPLAMYRKLIAAVESKEISFRNVTTFNLDEYLSLSEDSEQSFRSYMNREFFSRIDIDPANTHLPACASNENPQKIGARYEQSIRNAGGIDLQILGLGRNGHIGFNEPTSSLNSRTRVKTLTRQTLEDNSRFFSSDEFQPELAITMGMATIMDARQVLMLVTGEKKAIAAARMIEGSVSAMHPASALQYHVSATVLLDNAAASQLSDIDYYKFVNIQNERLKSKFGHEINYVGEK